jgi:hypothetical protein
VNLNLSVAADKDFLMKQTNILRLFHRVHQNNLFKDQVDEGNNYDIEAHIGNYKVRMMMQLSYSPLLRHYLAVHDLLSYRLISKKRKD